MGCSHSSSAGGCKGPSKDMSGDVTSQDDKHRNYGGVYVGLPADTTTAYRDPKGAEEASSETPAEKQEENLKQEQQREQELEREKQLTAKPAKRT
ncbi:overexpressed in colon carcinoma 1 protein isoform X2 [Phyllobates terribilis]|uniref:overexpressed in colon carcinoma 1 protein isoform X2 n=1 Tax=Phyllobates terribilis TaxID=111132 RepID=UPI003CCAC2BE